MSNEFEDKHVASAHKPDRGRVPVVCNAGQHQRRLIFQFADSRTRSRSRLQTRRPTKKAHLFLSAASRSLSLSHFTCTLRPGQHVFPVPLLPFPAHPPHNVPQTFSSKADICSTRAQGVSSRSKSEGGLEVRIGRKSRNPSPKPTRHRNSVDHPILSCASVRRTSHHVAFCLIRSRSKWRRRRDRNRSVLACGCGAGVLSSGS